VTAGERLVVARVRGFHGLRGPCDWSRSRIEQSSDLPSAKSLFLEGSDAPLTVVESEPDSLGWRVRFAEVMDRTAAESLLDAYLEAVVAPGEELSRGEFYWHQVVGASVADVDGSEARGSRGHLSRRRRRRDGRVGARRRVGRAPHPLGRTCICADPRARS